MELLCIRDGCVVSNGNEGKLYVARKLARKLFCFWPSGNNEKLEEKLSCVYNNVSFFYDTLVFLCCLDVHPHIILEYLNG